MFTIILDLNPLLTFISLSRKGNDERASYTITNKKVKPEFMLRVYNSDKKSG